MDSWLPGGDSADAAIAADLQGIVLSRSFRAETPFGYSAAEALGRSLKDLLLPRECDVEHLSRSCIRAGPGDTRHVAMGCIVPAHSRAARALAHEPGELIGEPVMVLLPERIRATHVGHLGQGCDAYIAKPVDTRTLPGQIMRRFDSPSGTASP